MKYYLQFNHEKPIKIIYANILRKKNDTGGTCRVMDIAVGNGHGDPSSNLDEAVCISNCTNTFR